MHVVPLLQYKQSSYWTTKKKAKFVDNVMVYFISSVNFVPHFGHTKVYETFVWTPCFQILAKTIGDIIHHTDSSHLAFSACLLSHAAEVSKQGSQRLSGGRVGGSSVVARQHSIQSWA